MTAPARSAAAEVVPAMPRTTDPGNPAATPDDAPAQAEPVARAAAGIGRRAWEQFAENPLQALFGAAIVALLVFNFTTFNARIDDTHDRITRLEDRVTRLEEKMDARFAALEEDVAEINLKLTALIAALNRTDEVDAALEGQLLERAPLPDPANVPSG